MTRLQASLTPDLVIINRKLHILVVKRKNPPFQDRWALPGGYVDEGETFLEAAVRELKEETGIALSGWQLTKVGTYDKPDRDPRGRVVSTAFKYFFAEEPEAIAGDDASEVAWWPFVKPGLAFDHDDIVAHAMNGY